MPLAFFDLMYLISVWSVLYLLFRQGHIHRHTFQASAIFHPVYLEKKGDVMCCSIEPICSFSLLVLKSWETLIFGRVSQLKHIYLSDPVLPLVSLIILLFQPVIWHQIKEKLITMLSNYPVLPEHANWCVYICMQISIQTADICIGCTLLDVDEVMFNMNISKTIKRWKPKFFTGGSRHQNKPESVILDRSKILAS